uniref:Secreted protein n=1 Tax=Echinococcus granulosus TaxID=6210 RepID=A0A068X579_ECHGR|nr:hypothetical protein EgrG_002059000 [Echinococcus granulosus]
MDGAGASDLHRAVIASWIGGCDSRLSACVCVMVQAWSAMLSRRVAVVSVEAADVSRGGAATGADLGGSSKYPIENCEGRGGGEFPGTVEPLLPLIEACWMLMECGPAAGYLSLCLPTHLFVSWSACLTHHPATLLHLSVSFQQRHELWRWNVCAVLRSVRELIAIATSSEMLKLAPLFLLLLLLLSLCGEFLLAEPVQRPCFLPIDEWMGRSASGWVSGLANWLTNPRRRLHTRCSYRFIDQRG